MNRLDVHRAHYQPATIGAERDDEPGLETWGWAAVALHELKPSDRVHREHLARQRRARESALRSFRAASHRQITSPPDAGTWREQFEHQRKAKRAQVERARRASRKAEGGPSNTPPIGPPQPVIFRSVCTRCGGYL